MFQKEKTSTNKSIKKTKTFLPHWVDLVLHKDEGDYEYDFGLFDKVFTSKELKEYKNPSFKHSFKIAGLLHILRNTDYKYVLYLDSDAVVLNHDVFDYPAIQLQSHDICGVSVSANRGMYTYGAGSLSLDSVYGTNLVPVHIPEINGGVLFLKNNDLTHSFLTDWLRIYHTYSDYHDQGALRYVLYSMGFRISYLPFSYNFRRRAAPKNEKIYVWHQRRVLSNVLRYNPKT
ncbi:MAG: hypothetical protein EBY39_14280 [Flavobacteriia bacterium]|nr:hypothetical protein [Flavobacteriia bacterium]